MAAPPPSTADVPVSVICSDAGPLTDAQFAQVVTLQNSCWWARDRTPEEIRGLLTHSSAWWCALDGSGAVIGFARVLTDWGSRAFLEDVMVSEAVRGRGVGKQLLAAIKSHPRLARVEQVALDTSPALAAGFYGPAGWELSAQDASSAFMLWYPAGRHPTWLSYRPPA